MDIFSDISSLRKSIGKSVDQRICEFSSFREKTSRDVFKELCFCLLTANFNAERSIKMQNEIGDGFLSLPEAELSVRLKVLGHRYPQARADYIVAARKHADSIKGTLESFASERDARDWLVKNIKGLGYKEASHFLRNIGYCDCAIIDFHIIDLLEKKGLIERPKTITPKKYLEIEKVLKDISEKSGLSLAELDLYLWYAETGKILK